MNEETAKTSSSPPEKPSGLGLFECGPASPAMMLSKKRFQIIRARINSFSSSKTNVMLCILMASTFSGSFAQSMMNIALPHVADHFSVTLSMANWIVVGYTIVAATAITLAAALLARYGLRKIFTVSCVCLAVGSLIGVVAVNFALLIAARLIQALSTGLLFPIVTGAIALLAPQEKRGTLLALNSGIIGVGQAVGPLLSGFLLTTFDLSIMFLPPACLGVALIIAGFLGLHDLEDRRHDPIDLLSILLSFAGLATFMYGVGEITHQPLPALISLAIGLALIAGFVVRQTKIKTPLLNLTPLRHPTFTIGVSLVMLGMMATSSMSLLLPLFYEGTAGDTAFMAGSLISIPLVVYALVAIAGGKLFDKHGIWPLVPLGFALVLAGFIGLYLTAGSRWILGVFLVSFLIYGGVGCITAPAKTKALNELSHELYSYGAAINSTFVQIANAIGSALFVGVLSADVLRETAQGVARAEAYAMGFNHTLIISLVLCAISLVLALFYSFKERHRISR